MGRRGTGLHLHRGPVVEAEGRDERVPDGVVPEVARYVADVEPPLFALGPVPQRWKSLELRACPRQASRAVSPRDGLAVCVCERAHEGLGGEGGLSNTHAQSKMRRNGEAIEAAEERD